MNCPLWVRVLVILVYLILDLVSSLPAFGQGGERVPYVVTSTQSVNARACPRLNCAIMQRFSPGDTVDTTGTVVGDMVSNSATWYLVDVNGSTMYIHSSLLTRSVTTRATAEDPRSLDGNWTEHGLGGASFSAPSDWVLTSGVSTIQQLGMEFLAETNPQFRDLAEVMSQQDGAFVQEVMLSDVATGSAVSLVADYIGYEQRMLDARQLLEQQLTRYGMQIVDSDLVTLGDAEAVFLHVEFPLLPNGGDALLMEIQLYYLSLARTDYTLTFTTFRETADAMQPVFDRVVESFQIRDAAAARAAEALDAGTVAHDSENVGELLPGRFQTWSLEADAGETVTISAQALDRFPEGPDLYLVVRRANGDVIAEGDDSGFLGANLNPRILDLTLRQAGTYTIEVHGYTGFTSGRYHLSLTSNSPTLQGEAQMT